MPINWGRRKDIADRVMVWQPCYSQDLESGKCYFKKSEIFDFPGILIEKDCNNLYTDEIFGCTVNRDVVVYFPRHNKQIATCMDHVKLVECKSD